MSKHELDNINNHINIPTKKLVSVIATCNKKRNEMAYLQTGVQLLEGQVNRLNNNDNQEQLQKIGNWHVYVSIIIRTY
jgi:hypothetical protein